MRRLAIAFGISWLALATASLAQDPALSLAERAKQQREKKPAARRILTNDDLASGPQRQEFADLHFRVALPPKWPEYQVTKNEFTIPCPETDAPKCGLAVVVTSMGQGVASDPNRILEYWRQKMLAEGGKETVEWQSLTVAGLPAGEHQLSFSDAEQSQMRIVYVLAKEQRRVYWVGLRAPRVLFDGHMAAFEKFLASFEPMLD